MLEQTEKGIIHVRRLILQMLFFFTSFLMVIDEQKRNILVSIGLKIMYLKFGTLIGDTMQSLS